MLQKRRAGIRTSQQRVHHLPDFVVLAIKRLGMSSVTAFSSLPMSAVRGLFDAVLIIFLSFYWLVAALDINRFLVSLFPPERQAFVDSVRADISHAMGGYVRGIIIDAITTGSIAWFGLAIVGVPYSPVLGVLTGIGEMIPYLGPRACVLASWLRQRYHQLRAMRPEQVDE